MALQEDGSEDDKENLMTPPCWSRTRGRVPPHILDEGQRIHMPSPRALSRGSADFPPDVSDPDLDLDLDLVGRAEAVADVPPDVGDVPLIKVKGDDDQAEAVGEPNGVGSGCT